MIPSPPERWTNSIALRAKEAFIDELLHHNLIDLAELYRDNTSEKSLAVILGVLASKSILKEDEDSRKFYMGLMFLATYLHEAKHSRPGSMMAAKLFWIQYERAHEGAIQEYLGITWQELMDIE